MSFLCDDDHLLYIDRIKEMSDKKKSIASQFPKTSTDLLEVLEEMVQFNPYFRPTTGELLKHRIFDEIRLPVEHVSKSNI